MLYFHLVALALVATALGVSGCGGSSRTQPAGPTHAEFVAKADAICRAFNAKMNSVSVNTQQKFERALPKTAVLARTVSEQLNLLAPAAGMESEWKNYLVGTRIFAEQSAIVANYAESHKVTDLSPLFVKTLQTQHKLGEIAKDLGFKDCSSKLV